MFLNLDRSGGDSFEQSFGLHKHKSSSRGTLSLCEITRFCCSHVLSSTWSSLSSLLELFGTSPIDSAGHDGQFQHSKADVETKSPLDRAPSSIGSRSDIAFWFVADLPVYLFFSLSVGLFGLDANDIKRFSRRHE
jgi:hypothetical protein